MWRRRGRELGEELVSDCEAFLGGTFAEHLETKRLTVPVWAWTNLLAHGSEGMLRAAARTPGAPGGTPGGTGGGAWRVARGELASAILSASGPDCPLAGLQSQALVPLELDLTTRPSVEQWTPRTWMQAVRVAVRSHRPSRHS